MKRRGGNRNASSKQQTKSDRPRSNPVTPSSATRSRNASSSGSSAGGSRSASISSLSDSGSSDASRRVTSNPIPVPPVTARASRRARSKPIPVPGAAARINNAFKFLAEDVSNSFGGGITFVHIFGNYLHDKNTAGREAFCKGFRKYCKKNQCYAGNFVLKYPSGSTTSLIAVRLRKGFDIDLSTITVNESDNDGKIRSVNAKRIKPFLTHDSESPFRTEVSNRKFNRALSLEGSSSSSSAPSHSSKSSSSSSSSSGRPSSGGSNSQSSSSIDMFEFQL